MAEQSDQKEGRRPSRPGNVGADVPADPQVFGSAPGAPGSTASAYTPGPNWVGDYPGGASAASIGGAGAGGDIDRPDITGRGSLEDMTGGPGRKTTRTEGQAPAPPSA